MIKKKKILFVTGTRADYGKLEPLAIEASRAGFQIAFFITGMHMMKRYGETRLEVRRFNNGEFFEFVNQREGDALDLILSKTILGFSDFVNEHRQDLVVIHGDRVEALGASIVCAMNYIPSAHIEGGEVSGTIDESIRHCNTKLCTSHFVSSEIARSRVLSLGEAPARVFNIGSPELDVHMRPSGVDIDEVRGYYDIPFEEFGIVIFHPVTSEIDTIGYQACQLFEALHKTGKSYVVIAPNNDPGTTNIFAVIEKLPLEKFRVIPSMRFNYFSELMKNASIMVGNSSAGVREAPFLGLASVDIGSRQKNRALATSVHSCSPFSNKEIEEAINKYWNCKYENDFSYGDGMAAKNFIKIVTDDQFWSHSLQKNFSAD